jgi:hypothetical protein
MRPQEPTIPVRYIGRAPYWRDKGSLHNSGLDFESGQVRAVPESIAKNLLRHLDLFARAPESEPVAAPRQDDTADQLLTERLKRDEAARLTRERFELLAQIERLDKAGLVKYAQDRFGQLLKITDTRENLRAQVQEMIDQYGTM